MGSTDSRKWDVNLAGDPKLKNKSTIVKFSKKRENNEPRLTLTIIGQIINFGVVKLEIRDLKYMF